MSKSKYEFQRNIAIIIGINDYNNGVPRLETAVPDAKELARIMQEQYQYEVHLLLDRDATGKKLEELIKCFNNKQIPFGKERVINQDDRILLYFAGHGIAFDAKEKQEGPVGYLIPQDATDNPDSYLKMQDFHNALLELPCRHLLVILDCCFSGAFYWSSINRDVVPKVKVYKQVYDHYIKYRAWQVITSTSDKQTAVDLSSRGKISVDSKVHSPFAKHLFDALNKAADLDNDGIITANDLFNYLRKQVAIETEEYKAQTPGICPLKLHENGEYLFLLESEPNLKNAPELDLKDSPYRGLESYEEEHKDSYFGRKEQIEQLYEKVNNSRKRALTVVLGASGTGKSSLVKAGLIPFLRNQKLQVNSSVQTWHILKPVRLGDSPLTALKNCLSQELNFTSSNPYSEQPQTDETQWFNKIFNWFGTDGQPSRAKQTHHLEKEVELLSQNLNNWFNRNSNHTLLLTIDQFEELITLQPRQQEKKQDKKRKEKNKKEEKQREKTQQELVLKWLPQVMSQYGERLRIVLTLRSDFESQFQDTDLKKYWTEEAKFHIKEMTTAELREAITEPASQKSIFFVPNTLIDKLIDEVAGMPGTLPLLSFTLNELYRLFVEDVSDTDQQNPKDDRAITKDYYNQLEGVAGSLRKRADEEYKKLVDKDKAYEQTIRHVMLRMVAVGGGELARRQLLQSELVFSDQEENKRIETVITHFSDARLLVSDSNSLGQSYVELAHDALIQGWPMLKIWIEQEEKQQSLFLQRRVTFAALEWQEKQKAWQFLRHDDPYLKIVNKERKVRPNWLNQLEDKFVQNSILKKNINFTGLCSIVIVAVGAAIFGFFYYRSSEINQIRAFVEASETDLSLNQNLEGLIKSLQAGEKLKNSWLLKLVKPNEQLQNQVRGNLQKAVYRVKERNRINLQQGTINLVAFSPNGQLLAITQNHTIKQDSTVKKVNSEESSYSTVSFWTRSGQYIPKFKIKTNVKDGWITSISFSPDSQQIITVTNATIKWWNLKGKEVISKQLNGTLNQVMINYNGKLVISNQDENQFILRDLANKTKLSVYKGSINNYAEYSPDGRFIATDTTAAQTKNLDSKTANEAKNLDTQKVAIPLIINDLRTNKEIAQLKQHRFNGNIPVYIRFSPNSKLVATAGDQDDVVCLWDLKGNQLAKFPANQGGISNIAFSPDGKQLATVGKDETVRIWQDLEGKPVVKLRGNSDNVTSISLNKSTDLLAIGYDNGTVRWGNWKNSKFKQISSKSFNLDRNLESVFKLYFSPDNRFLAVTDNAANIHIWNLKNKSGEFFTGRNISLDTGTYHRDQHGTLFQGLNFTQDGNYLAFLNSDGEPAIKSINDKSEKTLILPTNKLSDETMLDNVVQSTAFSFDGNLLANGWLDGGIQIWNWKKSKLLLPSLDANKGQVASIAFSPKGDIFATAGMDGSIGIARLWNLRGQLLAEFKGHQGLVNEVIFSPDGSLVATAGNDGTARVWNLSGQQLAEFKEYSAIKSIAFSLDSKKLATAGYGEKSEEHPYKLWQAKLWQIEDLDELLVRGCEWARDYLKNSSEVSKNNRSLCDKVPLYANQKISGIDSISTPSINQQSEAKSFATISKGTKILVPTLTNPNKQAGVEAIAAGDFTTAIKHLEASLKSNLNDPEARIYLNNARIGNQKSHTIAVSVPISTDVNSSLEILRGVAQAQELFNKWARTTNGQEVPFKVLIADDRNDPKVAQEIAKKFAENPDILGVIGHFASNVTLAAGEIYKSQKLVAISPVSTATKLSNFSPYTLRTVPSDQLAARSLAEYMDTQLKKKNAVVFYNFKSEYSKSLSSEFKSAIESKQGQFLEPVDLSDPNFNADEAIKDSINKGAEVLVLMPNTAELGKVFDVVEANARLGAKRLPLLAGDDVYGPTILQKIGEQASNMVVAVPWHIKAEKNNEGQRFADTSSQLWKGDVNWRTAMSYDATKALIAAIKKEPKREKVAKTLLKQGLIAEGSTGNVQFLASGDRKENTIELVKIVKSFKPRSPYGYEFIPVNSNADLNQGSKQTPSNK